MRSCEKREEKEKKLVPFSVSAGHRDHQSQVMQKTSKRLFLGCVKVGEKLMFC